MASHITLPDKDIGRGDASMPGSKCGIYMVAKKCTGSSINRFHDVLLKSYYSNSCRKSIDFSFRLPNVNL